MASCFKMPNADLHCGDAWLGLHQILKLTLDFGHKLEFPAGEHWSDSPETSWNCLNWTRRKHKDLNIEASF